MGLRKLFLKFLVHVILSLMLIVTLWFGTILVMSAADMIIPANQPEKAVAAWVSELNIHAKVTPEDIPTDVKYAIWEKDGRLLSSSLSKKELKTAKQLAASGQVQQNEGIFTHVYKKLETDTQIIVVVYRFQAHFANPVLRRLFPSFDLSMLVFLLLSVTADLILISSHYAKKLKTELLPLQNAAEQIKQQNLDFDIPRSRFHEFNHVLDSLDALKNELKHSLKEQWESEQLKKKQMAALAHDINTPLTILQGNAELLQESALDEEQQEYTRFILENTHQIRDYVSRMIEVSKNAQNTSAPVCRNLSALLTGILENAKTLDRQKSLHFSFSSRQLPEMIPVPEDALRRAVWNLIDNAVQYSPAGGTVRLTAGCQPRKNGEELTDCLQDEDSKGLTNCQQDEDGKGLAGYQQSEDGTELAGCKHREDGKRLAGCKHRENSNMLIIRVCDEGCGFSEEALQYALTEFYRGDESRGGHTHFGLGLAITKQIAASVNGKVQIENLPEGGASVTLLIPCQNLSTS